MAVGEMPWLSLLRVYKEVKKKGCNQATYLNYNYSLEIEIFLLSFTLPSLREKGHNRGIVML